MIEFRRDISPIDSSASSILIWCSISVSNEPRAKISIPEVIRRFVLGLRSRYLEALLSSFCYVFAFLLIPSPSILQTGYSHDAPSRSWNIIFGLEWSLVSIISQNGSLKPSGVDNSRVQKVYDSIDSTRQVLSTGKQSSLDFVQRQSKEK